MTETYISQLNTFKPKGLTAKSIIDEVSKEFDIAVEFLTIPDNIKGARKRELTFPRHIACFIMKHGLADYSLAQIGSEFNRDHASVLFACKTTSTLIDTRQANIRVHMDSIINNLRRKVFKRLESSVSTERTLTIDGNLIITNNERFV